jgi:hypothetical protein
MSIPLCDFIDYKGLPDNGLPYGFKSMVLPLITTVPDVL